MAELKIRDDSFLPKDGDFYEVVGPLTREDIKKINLFPRKSTLILENTKGLTSNLIDQIISPNIFFSVRGGYDYFRKKKYQNDEYIELQKFLNLAVGEDAGSYSDFEIIMEGSLSDFGDSDAIIIAKRKNNEMDQTVFFIEAKVSNGDK